MSAPNYPLPRPDGDDPRFSIGLQFDIAKVLTDHGYPPLAGLDRVGLGQALFGFLYASEDRPVPGAAVNAGAALTLEEYRSALDYWEQRAIEANTAGDRAEFGRRMDGVVSLRGCIRRLQGGPVFVDDKAPAFLQRCEVHVGLEDDLLCDLAARAVHPVVTR